MVRGLLLSAGIRWRAIPDLPHALFNPLIPALITCDTTRKDTVFPAAGFQLFEIFPSFGPSVEVDLAAYFIEH